MNSRRGGGKRSTQTRNKPKQILVFAEDKHDSDAIKCLVDALNPDLRKRAQVVVQRDPGSLTRDALPETVRNWMESIAAVVAVRSAISEVIGVLVHQDADAPDSGNVEPLQKALVRHVSGSAHPIVPVQEMETWWYLFPDGFRAVKPGAWRDVKMPTNTNVETIESPKEDLIRRTRAESPKNAYAESDSLAVAEQMAAIIRAGGPAENTSKSWSAFCDLARSL